MIRKARLDDVERLRNIEVAAGEVFRSVGMDAVADDEPPTVQDLGGYVDSGLAWVSTGPLGVPVGYIVVDVLDGIPHITQVTVHPHFARQGIGRDLIDAVAAWAVSQGFKALTLTTFRDVPWNAPYYQRLGFAVVPGHSWSEGVRRVVGEEAAHGLGAWPRVVMTKDLGGRP